jgi:hypothetical protein
MNDLSPPATSVVCRITTHAFVEARLSAISDLRGRPAAPGGPVLPPRFLRHADEHTVVGMHAVLDAITTSEAVSSRGSLEDHAVVAAPCQSGRLATARSLAALATGGAAVVTPHIVPQCSLHSVAGAVSVALGMHGPHFGVGGGPDSLGEGLLAATTLLMSGGDPACRGVWLVATEWDEEPALDAAGSPTNDPVCRAFAMLLEPRPVHGGGETDALALLTVRPPRHGASPECPATASCSLVTFAAALGVRGDEPLPVTTTLECQGGIMVEVARPRPMPIPQEAV